MERLKSFAKKFSKTVPGLAGCWLGDISDVRVSKRTREIARRAGFDPPNDLQLPQVSDVIAARVISYGMHSSLAYDQRKYRVGEAREFLDMLRELGPHAQFWSDRLHEDFGDTSATSGLPSVGLGRMTRAVFEVGVIAANETTGFIWWRGEDD
jgi:hypothetical protein